MKKMKRKVNRFVLTLFRWIDDGYAVRALDAIKLFLKMNPPLTDRLRLRIAAVKIAALESAVDAW